MSQNNEGNLVHITSLMTAPLVRACPPWVDYAALKCVLGSTTGIILAISSESLHVEVNTNTHGGTIA